MTLAFGVLSSHEPPASVAQLVDALGRDARVWIHHDDSKGPRPALGRRDVRFVRAPVATGWGEWSLCEAILALMREALEEPGWEHFQLLSGSCLPIRPIDDFARHVAASPADVHMDAIPLDRDDEALMSHGYRLYAPDGTLRHRVLRRLRRWYVGPRPDTVSRAGLSLAVPRADARAHPFARVSVAAFRAARRGTVPGFAHPFREGLGGWVGSTWWGARRAVCRHLVSASEDGPLAAYARSMPIPDECYFQTLACSGDWRVGPSNHWITPFAGAHPGAATLADLPPMLASRRWFARKFAPDAADPARRVILARLYSTPAHDRRRLARVA
jgi:hypothetical protein